MQATTTKMNNEVTNAIVAMDVSTIIKFRAQLQISKEGTITMRTVINTNGKIAITMKLGVRCILTILHDPTPQESMGY